MAEFFYGKKAKNFVAELAKYEKLAKASSPNTPLPVLIHGRPQKSNGASKASEKTTGKTAPVQQPSLSIAP